MAASNSYFILICYILVLIGAINWGLLGAARINLVETIVPFPTAERIVYIAVGVAAIILIATRFTQY
jgi:uncharacterized membrane protein YuzA (DUF378 family)